MFRDSGCSGLYRGHAPSYHRYVGTVFVGAVLAGFWEPTFFMAGSWESVLLGPASWSRLSRIFLGGGSLRLGRLLGVGPGDSRPGEGGPMLCMLEGSNGLIIFRRARGSRLGYPWPFTPTVVPEAGWASRLRGGREARSASYLDEPAAGSRLRLGAPSWRNFLKSEGGSQLGYPWPFTPTQREQRMLLCGLTDKDLRRICGSQYEHPGSAIGY